MTYFWRGDRPWSEFEAQVPSWFDRIDSVPGSFVFANVAADLGPHEFAKVVVLYRREAEKRGCVVRIVVDPLTGLPKQVRVEKRKLN